MINRDQLVEELIPWMGEGSIPEKYAISFANQCADKILALRDPEVDRLQAELVQKETYIDQLERKLGIPKQGGTK